MSDAIKISKIKNEELREIATEIDDAGNKNKKLDGYDEISLFMNKVKEEGLSDNDEYKAWGLELKNKSDEASDSTEKLSVSKSARRTERHANKAQKKNDKKTTKNEELQEKINKIYEMYNWAKQALDREGNSNPTNEQIMDYVKQNYLKAQSEYSWSEYKKAFKAVEAKFVSEAKDKVRDAIIAQTDSTKYKKIKNEARAELREQEDYDKYVKQAASRHYKTRFENRRGENSFIKNDAILKARMNNVKNHKEQSKAAILYAIGNDLFNLLTKKGYIIENEDGSCDLTKLSELIRLQVGADYELSLKPRDTINSDEKGNTKNKLTDELGYLTDGQVKALVKLCGFDIESRNWLKSAGKVILGGTVGFLSGLGSGATAAATTRNVLSVGDQIIDVDFTSSSSKENVIVNLPGFKAKFPKGIGSTALKTGLITAGLGLLGIALDEIFKEKSGEVSILPTNFNMSTYDEYIEFIDNKNDDRYTPALRSAVKVLASAYLDEDGHWDKEGYMKKLNEIAGDQSHLNKNEIEGAILELESQPAVTPVVSPTVVEQPEEEPEPVKDEDEDEPCCDVVITTEDKTLTCEHNTKAGESWDTLVDAYYPNLRAAVKNDPKYKNINNPAVRALKIALSYDDTGKFNEKIYNELLRGTDLPKTIILPAEIEGIKRVEDCDVQIKTQTITPSDNPTKALGRAGTEQVETTYIATDGCDETLSATGFTQEEAIENLKEVSGKTY